VKAAVFNDPSLKSGESNVETFKGTVQLSGFVSSQADIDKAVEVARSVKGVKSVKTVVLVPSCGRWISLATGTSVAARHTLN
jgi:osmotically-inducible protein OsmY